MYVIKDNIIREILNIKRLNSHPIRKMNVNIIFVGFVKNKFH